MSNCPVPTNVRSLNALPRRERKPATMTLVSRTICGIGKDTGKADDVVENSAALNQERLDRTQRLQGGLLCVRDSTNISDIHAIIRLRFLQHPDTFS